MYVKSYVSTNYYRIYKHHICHDIFNVDRLLTYGFFENHISQVLICLTYAMTYRLDIIDILITE